MLIGGFAIMFANCLYQTTEWLTLRIPNHLQNDSTWQTEGGLPWEERLR